MANIQMDSGKILMDSGQIAKHEDCCCDAVECNSCSDGVPLEMLVTISGLSSLSPLDLCDSGECESLNGEYILTFVSGEPLTVCHWLYEFEDICGLTEIRLVLHKSPITTSFVSFGPPVKMSFNEDSAPDIPYDCENFDEGPWDPLFVGGTTYCDLTGATATIEAVIP